MSVVIIGGNECMVRQYVDLCSAYKFKARVYPKLTGSMRAIGNPNLLVLFTNTVSHKMVKFALTDTKGKNIRIARSHSSSLASLKNILEEHTAWEAAACRKS